MEQMTGTRRYDSQLRRAQADSTRARVIEVTRDMLLSTGYARTTMPKIARSAGVSVETIYKAFGGKPGLVMAVYEHGIAGDQALSTGERSAKIKAHEHDPRRLVAAWGEFTAEVAPRIVPLM